MTETARILTIEDEPPIRNGIVTYLEDSGFTMLEAHDGPTGLELFRREQPDVVLCDLRLPGMDGLEVLSAITSESPETPVIVVSGVSLLSYAVQALRRGAWDYVTKPIHDMAVLESAVRRVLEHADLLRQNRMYRENLEKLNRELSRTLKQLQEDEEAGRRIQSQLLPREKQVYGHYAFRSKLYPSMYLSGDFVDYFRIDDHRIGFYMADVSGHGAASAFVTVMLNTLVNQYRTAHRTGIDETILSPSATLLRLNRDVCAQKLDKHLTMFYCILDSGENSLIYSSAGQFPYPLLHDGHQTRQLECRGRPIGLFGDAEFREWKTSLPEDFVLVLASDGVLELLSPGQLMNRCNTLLEAGDSVDEFIEELTAGLDVLADKHLPDDIAFLVLSSRVGNG